jgi:GT2 family glycosyltransferase/glycosyltransferase involved in cell wall biosynthesis
MKTTASTASVVGVEGRRLYIFVENYSGDNDAFSYTMNGEPVHVTHASVHKHGIACGLNLVANGTFTSSDLPWRAGGSEGVSIGQNLSPQWTLAGAGTAYLSIAAGQPAYVEYLYSAENPLVPVASGEHYTFAGHFALHRCAATVNIDLVASDETLLTCVRRHIPRMRGGQSLSDYARIEFNVAIPERCAYARIRFSIEPPTEQGEPTDSQAYLFYTQVAFSAAGDAPVAWRPRKIQPSQIAALSGSAAILGVTFPRFAANAQTPPPIFDVIDKTSGLSIHNSPITLPPAAELGFAVASFDGVTLTGAITNASDRFAIELVVDDIVAERRNFDAVEKDKLLSVSFRIPDSFLDGNPHVLELRDAASGATLFINAVTLKALVTSWEQTDDLGRLALPIELHPMSRRRYRSLLAHIDAAARNPQRQTSHEGVLGRCHELMLRADIEDDTAPLILSEHKRPEVSVIISAPDVTQVHRTIAALLLAYNDSCYEVIVSTDDEPEKVERVKRQIAGVEFVTSPTRLGRAQLLNRGASAARGRFIALLDVRAEPCAYWIDELCAAFSLFDRTGLAGGKLVKPNGRLQEAGGVLWSSGNRQAVGANGNAEHPQINYARQADYVSDRALLVPAKVWRAIGGLSEDLFGTSLEDADLSLKIRAAGYKVVYAPQAVVTIRPDAGNTQSKKTSAAHFKRRWSQALQQRPAESTPVRALMDFGIKDRVLFIDQQVPRIDVDAGSYAAIQEMRLFQALGYKVTFLPLNLLYSEIYVKSLERIGIEIIYAPFAATVEEALKERGEEFQLVYITRHHVARAVVPFVRRFNPQAKIIFNNADLHFLRELRSALALNDGELLQRSRLTRDLELDIMRQTDLTISYNEVEHAVVLSHNLDQTKIAKAPWVVTPAESPPPFQKRSDMGFLGSFGHRPNIDAMKFFAQEVLPLLGQSVPDIRMQVFGSQIGPEVKSLENDRFIMKGHVGNLADAFDSLRVFVAPLTAGAGLKGKVLNAMAHGLPTVLSPAAAEGIGAYAGVHYLGAQSPQEWVTAIAKLNSDEALWNAISRQAQDFVRENYSFDRGAATLRAALEKIDIFPAPNQEALCCRAAIPPLR